MSKSIRVQHPPATPTHRPRPTSLSNADALLKLWQWFLPANILSGITLHGNIAWTPNQLVIQAFCWTWSAAHALTEAFDEATHSCRTLLGAPALSTYQGFMAALTKWSATLIRNLIRVLHQHAQQIGGRFWQIGHWIPIAFDGSRSTAPRTKSNETAYRAANYGKGKTARYRKKQTKDMRRTNNQKNNPQLPEPQVWMTLLWHMGLRLPWAWRLGPSNASERDHVMTMLSDEDFPKQTLFCGDAGFIGYPLWAKILKQGHDFLVRSGANVHLLVESLNGRIVQEGQDQFVLCWPKDAQRDGLPPLRLRLIHMRIKKTKLWLLTSVLARSQLSLGEVIRLYQLRWGIEVEFRGLKQTLNRGELRCRNDERVLVELDWSILGMAVVELWALKEQMDKRLAKSKAKEDVPRNRSLSGAMRALRWCLRNLREACELGRGLADRLRVAVTDDYKRRSSKQARYRPLNPDKKPLGDPKLRVMAAEEKRKLQDTQPIRAA
jgi:hypothetical protein